MRQCKVIDTDVLWKIEQGWNVERKQGRKYDDAKELEFWQEMAPVYSRDYNLYRDVTGLGEWIHKKIGDGQRVIDLGCGSGNFTLPMAKYSKEILALDFSSAMLKELEKGVQKEHLTNVRPLVSKWETFMEEYPSDYVLAVNSLYRMCDMRSVLEKIVKYGRKGFIIVRTLLKPILYDLYEKLDLGFSRNSDYMVIPLILWDMGIHAEVRYTKYDRTVTYPGWEAVEKEMIRDMGELTYLNYNTQLKTMFMQKAVRTPEGFTYRSERVVAVISYIHKEQSL